MNANTLLLQKEPLGTEDQVSGGVKNHEPDFWEHLAR